MIYFSFLLKLLYYILESIMKEIQNKKSNLEGEKTSKR